MKLSPWQMVGVRAVVAVGSNDKLVVIMLSQPLPPVRISVYVPGVLYVELPTVILSPGQMLKLSVVAEVESKARFVVTVLSHPLVLVRTSVYVPGVEYVEFPTDTLSPGQMLGFKVVELVDNKVTVVVMLLSHPFEAVKISLYKPGEL